MTLKEFAAHLRIIAAPVGPLHGHWDLIFDIEAMERGAETLLPYARVRAMAAEQAANLGITLEGDQ